MTGLIVTSMLGLMAPFAGWELVETALTNTEKHDILWQNYNDTDNPVSMLVNYSSATYRSVTGSDNNSPAWTTKFATLSSDWTPVTFNDYVSIPAHKKRTYTLNYYRETGHETWKETTDPELQPQVSRLRAWDSPYSVTHVDVAYP